MSAFIATTVIALALSFFLERGKTLAGLRKGAKMFLNIAKKRGAYRGRKKALSPDQVVTLRQRAAAGEQKAALAREFGISRETLYQYLRSID